MLVTMRLLCRRNRANPVPILLTMLLLLPVARDVGRLESGELKCQALSSTRSSGVETERAIAAGGPSYVSGSRDVGVSGSLFSRVRVYSRTGVLLYCIESGVSMLGRSDISRIPVVAPVMLPSALSFSTDPRCAVMVEAEDGGSRSTPAPNGGRRLRCECAYTCGPTPPIPTCAVLSEISNGRGPAPFFGRLLNETRRTNEGIAFTVLVLLGVVTSSMLGGELLVCELPVRVPCAVSSHARALIFPICELVASSVGRWCSTICLTCFTKPSLSSSARRCSCEMNTSSSTTRRGEPPLPVSSTSHSICASASSCSSTRIARTSGWSCRSRARRCALPFCPACASSVLDPLPVDWRKSGRLVALERLELDCFSEPLVSRDISRETAVGDGVTCPAAPIDRISPDPDDGIRQISPEELE
mmetsp:Transcript_59741/g.140720  ORF Transcript_59741/g.140720 Transcript_59741/m.140720 type:complete len:416 (-) Transcript_59741:438-1685(-)